MANLGNDLGHTDDELRTASWHVFYEVNMLVDTTNALQSRAIHGPTITNALLESFGVHARVLIDFLMTSKPIKDDVYAALYFPAGAWTPPTLPAALDPVKVDVNKHSAHVTFSRLKFDPTAPVGNRKQWDVLTIAKARFGEAQASLSTGPTPRLRPEDDGGASPRVRRVVVT